MPRYTAPFDPKKGSHIDVFLSKPLSIYEEDEAESSKYKLNMLIDTGASKTAISPDVAQKIGLIPTGKRPLRSATGEVSANMFQADLVCELFTPSFYLPDLQIIEFKFAQGWHGGFLGRDFLEKIIFEINGPENNFKITV